MLITITEGADYNPEALTIYSQLGALKIIEDTLPLDWDLIKKTQVLVVRLKHRLDKSFLERCLNLKFIITPTTGLNHIDLEAAENKGITVLSLKGETEFLSQIPSTAEHTWTLFLSLYRRLVPAVNHTLKFGWNRDLFKGYNVRGKTLGILGLGRVGKQVAGFGKAFGMNVIYFDPYIIPENGLATEVKNIQDLFQQADVLSIHIPLQKETERIVDVTCISHMKPNAVLINTSRGEIWDEEAVAQALRNKAIAGVATDVLSDEFDAGKIQSNPLVNLQREGYPIIITPHLAGATFDSMHDTELFMAKKFNQLLKVSIE